MKKIIYYQMLCIALFSSTMRSQTSDNAELYKMYTADQDSRNVENINWKILNKQDSLRETRVHELIKEGKVLTGKDYYHSAMIFQHGKDTIASKMAVKHMRRAIELDSNINKWLLPAAIDRDLMRRDRPQLYGTQFIKMGENAKWERYKMDTTKVTDEERKYYGIESLAEQRIKERNMNLISVSTYYSTSNSIDKTIQFIKAEKKKGNASAYNVSEEELNNFAYNLLNEHKDQEALKVFKLNTELYPLGFNAFDSYGECLMKLNKKEEGLNAYKKSLALNPGNENARKILEANK